MKTAHKMKKKQVARPSMTKFQKIIFLWLMIKVFNHLMCLPVKMFMFSLSFSNTLMFISSLFEWKIKYWKLKKQFFFINVKRKCCWCVGNNIFSSLLTHARDWAFFLPRRHKRVNFFCVYLIYLCLCWSFNFTDGLI